ncbi:MAG: L-threonylcarbamoyladenylate synthase [Patescibacteria group bacterium]
MSTVVKQAVEVLNRGGIIIYPTDTAFGIGCRIDCVASVNKLFRLRRRPATQAMPILVASPQMALPYLDHPSDIVRHLMDQYWPGALTIVAPGRVDLIYSPIRGGGKNIGVRMPNHETALAIIRSVGVPILGPSANFHGGPTPFHQEDLDQKLVVLVDFVVPGKCELGTVSTVVDCSVTPYRIIRQGGVLLKNVILSIDTARSEIVQVTLEIAGEKHTKTAQSRLWKAQTVLPLIEELLCEQGLKPSDIVQLEVNTGPGSFTGLRVGVAIANMLGTLLNLPVNRSPTLVLPKY